MTAKEDRAAMIEYVASQPPALRQSDLMWQAFQAGVNAEATLRMDDLDSVNETFREWLAERTRQGCIGAACEKCGHDPLRPVAASWTIVIDRDPPSMNARIVNNKASAHAYRRERDTWHWELKASRLQLKIPKATSSRRVTLERRYDGRQRPLDRDNLVGGMKAIVDAMVREKLLLGDDAASVQLHYTQAQRSPRGLAILIEELA